MEVGSNTLVVRVRNFVGDEVCRVVAKGSWSVLDVKCCIEKHKDVPVWQQRLVASWSSNQKMPPLRDSFLLGQVLDNQDSDADKMLDFTLVRLLPAWAKAIDDLRNGRVNFSEAPLELQQNREFVLDAVGCNGLSLQYAASSFQADRDIVLAAVSQNVEALKFASPDRGLLVYVLSRQGSALRMVSKHHRSDARTVLAAVQSDGGALQYAAKSCRGDKDVVLAAVTRKGRALQVAAQHLRADKEVALAAVTSDGTALAYVEDSLRDDVDVVFAAAAQNRKALCHASRRLRGDRSFVLGIVAQDARALRYVASPLRDDADVLAATVAARRRQRQASTASEAMQLVPPT